MQLQKYAGNSLASQHKTRISSLVSAHPGTFDLRLNKRFSKPSTCWLFETPSNPSWRVVIPQNTLGLITYPCSYICLWNARSHTKYDYHLSHCLIIMNECRDAPIFCLRLWLVTRSITISARCYQLLGAILKHRFGYSGLMASSHYLSLWFLCQRASLECNKLTYRVWARMRNYI